MSLRSKAFLREIDFESVAHDDAVSAGAGGGDVIFLKERNGELGQTHWRAKSAAGYGGSKFAGQECLLRAGRHVGGDDITVIENEIRAGLALVVGRVNA